jgi:hypothetical protein
MAATWPAFWEHYWGTEPCSRHYYEIIREDSPCHLYFGAPLQIALPYHRHMQLDPCS